MMVVRGTGHVDKELGPRHHEREQGGAHHGVPAAE
jgi:hypothetical protein